jgi:hypothetical protein
MSGMSMNDAGGIVSATGNKEPRWDEKIRWFDFPADKEAHLYRLVSKGFIYSTHWLNTKKGDGSVGKAFPILCKNYDSATNKRAKNGCKMCDYLQAVRKAYGETKYESWDASIKKAFDRAVMAHNVICREIQEAGAPPNKQAEWTFIVPMRFPQGVVKTLSELAEKFNKRGGATHPLNHAVEGRDIYVSYDPAATEAAKMYQVQLDMTPKPLTQEEMAHAKFLIDFAPHLKYPTDDAINEALERNGYITKLENLQTQAAIISIPSGASLKAPVAPAPAAVQAAAPSANASAFAVGDAPAPAMPVDDIPMGSCPPAATPAAPAPSPVQQQAPAQAAPVAPTPAAPEAPAAKPTVEQSLVAFAGPKNIALSPFAHTDKLEGLAFKYFKPGMAVPACFGQYADGQPITTCKTCPIKFDCSTAMSVL